MRPQVQNAQVATELPLKLPIHLKSLLIGVRSRRRLLALFTVGSVLCGLAAARVLGKNSYQARTVLLYRPPPAATGLPAGEVDENNTPTLFTLMDMVKVDTNLQEVHRRLRLKEGTDTIGSLIRVDVPINSSLMTITVTTSDPNKAANIANATRQVFLEQELQIQRAQAGSRAKDLAARQDKVMQELQTAERNLKQFTIEKHVVDLDKEAGWYLQQLINTELVYEEAVGQNSASRLQQANIGRIADKLESKVQAEEAQVAGTAPAVGDPTAANNTFADEAIRGRVADLKMKEIDMTRAKTLADEGIYSRREYEKAKAAFEQERFLLYRDSPSAVLYKEMNLRELDVQLAHISDQQKVAHLREAVDHVHARLDALPLVQRDYLALSREVAIRAAEREHIDQLLGVARRENESQTFGFSIVSEATPPLLPMKSNRRFIFITLTLLGTAFGFGLVLLLEVADRRLRSVGDAKAKLATQVLAGLPRGIFESTILTDEALSLNNRLRQMGVRAGTRLLVASASEGEGAPDIAHLLARIFSTGGDSVLLVDANFRTAKTLTPHGPVLSGWRQDVDSLLRWFKSEIYRPKAQYRDTALTDLAPAQYAKGFADLLATGGGNTETAIALSDRIRLLPTGPAPRPEILLSQHIGRVLKDTAFNSDIVLINTSPVLAYPDATLLAGSVDFAVIVAAAGKMTAEKIGSSIRTLESFSIPVLGIVLTNTAEVYAERQAA